jgi:hypothetical protein
MGIEGAPFLADASFRGHALPAGAARLRGLLERVQACDERDETLSHDVWWELVDVPTGATREIGGVREINYTAADPFLKPFWRAPGNSHFEDQPDGPLLLESLDRAADFAARVLSGWRWQLYSGGGPDNDKCFACVHSRQGAFSAVANTMPGALIAAVLEAKIALAGRDDPQPFLWKQPLAGPPARRRDAYQASAVPVAPIRLAAAS